MSSKPIPETSPEETRKKRGSDQVDGNDEGEDSTKGGRFAKKGGTNTANAPETFEDGGKKRGSDQVIETGSNNRSNDESTKRKKLPKPLVVGTVNPIAATASAAAAEAAATARAKVKRRPSTSSRSKRESVQNAGDSSYANTTKIRRKSPDSSSEGQRRNSIHLQTASTETTVPSTDDPKSKHSTKPREPQWDIESALTFLASSPHLNCIEDKKDHSDEREYLLDLTTLDADTRKRLAKGTTSHHSSAWITFRTAHAGDATTLAGWYQRQGDQKQQKEDRNVASSNTSAGEEKGSKSAQKGSHDGDEAEEDPQAPTKAESFERQASSDSHETNDSREKIPQNSSDTEINDGRDRKRRLSSSSVAATKTDSSKNPNQTTNSTMLEHWLADGLGNEDNCPSLYGLLAYINTPKSNETNDLKKDKEDKPDSSEETKPEPNENDKRGDDETPSTEDTVDPKSTASSSDIVRSLCAAVLLTVNWQNHQRCLQIEWMAIGGCDDEQLNTTKNTPTRIDPLLTVIIQQKLWLRITALSVMIDCQLIRMEDQVREFMATVSNNYKKVLEKEEEDGDGRK